MRIARSIAVAVVISGALVAMYAVPRVLAGPLCSIGAVVGYATVGGHPAVLAAYGRIGGAGSAPFGGGDHWQERLAAVSLRTGDLLWDVQLHGKSGWDRAVLVVADGLAYVATDYGLSIVAVEDGRIVAQNDHIRGLDNDYAQAYTAYHVDPRRRAVIALTQTGDIVEIPLGTTEAAPAPAAVADAWRATLIADSAPMRDATFNLIDVDPAATPKRMALPDGGAIRLSRETGVLIRERPDGHSDVLTHIHDMTGPELIYEIVRTPAALATAEQLAEGTGMFTKHHSAAAPLGTVSGVVLVRGDDPNAAGRESLRLIDVGSGETVAVVADLNDIKRATATPDGHILVIATPAFDAASDNRLIVLRPDGRVVSTDIGLTDFWGRTRADARSTDAR
ncbi:PA2928 family protein [Mycolicibacterium celeriflavum]|uniref:PA2928 family protein n=1 Tax=Mycolicibacterium celeriflavum TaxID=1249101 RepID=UPI003CF9CD67